MRTEVQSAALEKAARQIALGGLFPVRLQLTFAGDEAEKEHQDD
jgi:hypothetical protein